VEDTDPEFFNRVAILVEASRLDPVFARQVLEASTDERVDALVEQGKAIIDDQADQAWL
jgi:hypothetical protein